MRRGGKWNFTPMTSLSLKGLQGMQVGQTTYAAQTVQPQISPGTQGAQVGFEEKKPVGNVDRYEPTQAVMGAADALPGQSQKTFEVTGEFGFCQNCGVGHGSSLEEDKSENTPKVNGENIPDLHAVLEETEAVGDLKGGEDSEKELEAEDENKSLSGDVELSEDEQQEVEELKRRDQEVRTHEHAHVAAGGQHVRGGISYEYQVGPDGKRYAVGGEVSIDTSAENSPEDTIRKAQTIRQAALAPAEPSGQDRRAAAAAAQMEMKARQEISEEKIEGGDEEEAVDEAAGLGREEENGKASDLPMDRAGQNQASQTHQEKGLPDAGGLPDVDKPSSANSGLTPEKKESGLPEVSATSSSPPVARLDYGQSKHTGSLMDMYG